MVSHEAVLNSRHLRAQPGRDNSGLTRILMGFAVYYLIVIGLSLILGGPGAWLAIMLTIGIGLFLILQKIEVFFAAFVVFLLTFRYVTYYFNMPTQFELVPVFLSFASALSLLFGGRNSQARSGTLMLVLYGIFFLPWILGAAFTSTNLPQVGISFAWRFHGLFLFATAYLHPRITTEWMRRYLIIAGVILAAQFPIQVLQALNLPGQLLPPNETYVANGLAANADYFSGTFGWLGGDALGVLELGAIYVILCYGLIKGFSIRLIGLAVLFFIPTIVGDITFARLGVLLFPFLAISLWSLAKVNNLGRLVRSVLILFVIIAPLILALLTLGEQYAPGLSAGGRFIKVSNLLDPEAWMANLSQETTNENFIYGRQAGRATALQEAASEILQADKAQFLVGYGPDSLRVTGSTLFGTMPSRLPTKSILYSFYGFDRLLLETGVVGTGIFLAILVYPFIRVLQFARTQPAGKQKMWAIMYMAVWLIFMATGQYDGGWFEPYQKVTIFWLLTAGILSVIDTARARSQNNSNVRITCDNTIPEVA